MNMNEKINKYPDTSYTVRRRAATVEVVPPPPFLVAFLSFYWKFELKLGRYSN